jgi:hypothetical protein
VVVVAAVVVRVAPTTTTIATTAATATVPVGTADASDMTTTTTDVGGSECGCQKCVRRAVKFAHHFNADRPSEMLALSDDRDA